MNDVIHNVKEAAEPTRRAELQKFVASKILRIQGALLGPNPKQQARARALLSTLRKAPVTGNPVHSAAWQLVLGETGLARAGNEETELFPSRLQFQSDVPSSYELAAYTALVCFAHHQQSQLQPMHQAGKRFATVVGSLVLLTSPSVKARFDSLTNARHTNTINTHLRSIISLLRSQDLSLDYGRLAGDLVQLYSPESRNLTLMRWSREFVSGYFPSTTTPHQAQ